MQVTPIYKRRKPGLGYYNATREEWEAAWRTARIRYGNGLEPNTKNGGIMWKAELIINNERDSIDILDFTPEQNLMTKKLIEKILAED